MDENIPVANTILEPSAEDVVILTTEEIVIDEPTTELAVAAQQVDVSADSMDSSLIEVKVNHENENPFLWWGRFVTTYRLHSTF